MRVISVNVGLPREVPWQGKMIKTSIFKEPIDGRVTVRQLNLDGDRQADLAVHGGKEKAIYVYSAEYYQYWREQLPGVELAWGAFGENFTVEGLLDTTVAIGDRLRVGTVLCKVTQPRIPCFKLNIKFARTDMIQRFSDGNRSGFYLSVIEEGEVTAGDPITVLERDEQQITVTDIARLFAQDSADLSALKRGVTSNELPTKLRTSLQNKVARIERERGDR